MSHCAFRKKPDKTGVISEDEERGRSAGYLADIHLRDLQNPAPVSFNSVIIIAGMDE